MRGWRIVAAATLFLLLAFYAVVATCGTEEYGLRVLTRATARLSFLFFLPVYVASSAAHLWPGATTKWMLKNRRYLGLSFFVAHMLHLDAILLLRTLQGDAFQSDPVTIYGGGLAYLLITLMALTSSHRAVKWLGPQRWGRLHRVGIHYVWFVWALQWTAAAVFEAPAYASLALLTFAALAVRIAARRAKSQPATASAA